MAGRYRRVPVFFKPCFRRGIGSGGGQDNEKRSRRFCAHASRPCCEREDVPGRGVEKAGIGSRFFSHPAYGKGVVPAPLGATGENQKLGRSEERRVRKECRSR